MDPKKTLICFPVFKFFRFIGGGEIRERLFAATGLQEGGADVRPDLWRAHGRRVAARRLLPAKVARPQPDASGTALECSG